MAVLTLYGSSVADTTLTTACDMAAASGGTETTKLSSVAASPVNPIAEITSQGITGEASLTSIPATPTGKGWVYNPGAGTFALGNWSATFGISDAQAPYTIDNGATMRFFKYSGGSYTLIGSSTSSSIALLSTKTTVTIPATSFASTTFAAADLLYVDLWVNRTGGINNSTINVYESTSSTAGVTNDMQVTTANFTPVTTFPEYIPRVFGGTLVLTYIPRVFGGILTRYGITTGATASTLKAAGRFTMTAGHTLKAAGRAVFKVGHTLSASGRVIFRAPHTWNASGRASFIGRTLRNGMGRAVFQVRHTLSSAGRAVFVAQHTLKGSGRAVFRVQHTLDTAGRALFRVAHTLDTSGRFFLGVQHTWKGSGRAVFRAGRTLEGMGRFILLAPGAMTRRASGRFRMIVARTLDTAGRFRMAVSSRLNASGRAVFVARHTLSTSGRSVFTVARTRLAQGRAVFVVRHTRNGQGRLSLAVQGRRDAQGRAAFRALHTLTSAGRFRLGTLGGITRSGRGRFVLTVEVDLTVYSARGTVVPEAARGTIAVEGASGQIVLQDGLSQVGTHYILRALSGTLSQPGQDRHDTINVQGARGKLTVKGES